MGQSRASRPQIRLRHLFVIVSLAAVVAWSLARHLAVGVGEPNLARIVVTYDVPGGDQEGRIFVQHIGGRGIIGTKGPPHGQWNPVKNGGTLELKDLPPGDYQVARQRHLDVAASGLGRMFTGAFLDRRRLTLKAGETAKISFVRTVGQPLSGRVLGLKAMNLDRAAVFVCSEGVEDASSRSELDVVTFDAKLCDAKGNFETETLAPGEYVIIVEGYEGESQHEAAYTGWRQPRYVGISEVTVPQSGVVPTVEVELKDTLTTEG